MISEHNRLYITGVICVIFGMTVLPVKAVAGLETISVVKDGKCKTARFWQTEWAADASGGSSDTNLENVIYADCYVGSGDFRVDATLAIDSLHDNFNAGFVMNEYNVFGFNSDQGRMYTKGRMWGRQLLSTVATNVIQDGEEFSFVLERKEGRLSVSINGILVHEIDFDWRWAGELGFRCLRVVDFSVTGHMLSLEEYLYNSPTYGRDKGPIQIAPVVLPEGVALVGNAWHLGWPVATKAGNALVAAFHRAQHHNGSSRPDSGAGSAAMVVRSVDGGQTWSSPFDLESIIQTPATYTPGGMRAIGTSSRGTVVLLSRKGVFRSTDNGVTWTHYPNAFEGIDEVGVSGYNLGPRIIETADGRLLVFAHVSLSGGKWSDWMLCWISDDDGKSWKQHKWHIPEGFHPVEPSVLLLNDTFYVLGRYHETQAFEPATGLFSMVQLALPYDERNTGDARITNIHTTYAFDVLTSLAPLGKEAALGGFWSQDTADIAYNPVTKRIEAVVVNRTGGGQGAEQDIAAQTVNLWSIDPEDFRAGDIPWRFEATLLERNTMDVTKMVDGMHPGGAVIDTTAGVQHIFVYLGYYHGPSGIFKITRSLDTPLVADWWNSVKQLKPASRICAEREYFASVGSAIVSNPALPELIKEGLLLYVDGGSADFSQGKEFWNDVRSNGISLRVPAGAQAPQIVSNAVNNLSAVKFSSTGKICMELSAAQSVAFNPGPDGLTFFIVFRTVCFRDTWQKLIHKGNTTSSGHEGFSINLTSFAGGYGRVIARAASGKGSRCAIQSHVRSLDSGFQVYSAILEEKRGWQGYLNGDVYLTGAGARPFGPQETFGGAIKPSDNLGIGTDFDGEIAEILIYKRVLNLNELNQVNAYIRQKYALTFPDALEVGRVLE